MELTNKKQLLQDDAAAPSSASAEASSAAAADVSHLTAIAAASASETWARLSSPPPPPVLLLESPQERGPEPTGAGTGGTKGWSSSAVRVGQKSKNVAHVLPVAAGEEPSASTGSRRSLLAPRPASPVIYQVKWPQAKDISSDCGSYSSSWNSAILSEKMAPNTLTPAHLPIPPVQGRSADPGREIPQGSRYWEHHKYPADVEGMNPPGFFSPHPIWEGFAIPVQQGRKRSYYCVACEKLLVGSADRASKHMLVAKGCTLTKEQKMYLEERIRGFESKRDDLKRKRMDSKKGVVEDLTPQPVGGVIPNNPMSWLDAEITNNTEDGSDQLSGTTECGSSPLRYPPSCGGPEVDGAGAKTATMQGQLGPDEDQVSSSDPCSHSCLTAVAETLTPCPSTGEATRTIAETSGGGQESYQDQVSPSDPLSYSWPADKYYD